MVEGDRGRKRTLNFEGGGSWVLKFQGGGGGGAGGDCNKNKIK